MAVMSVLSVLSKPRYGRFETSVYSLSEQLKLAGQNFRQVGQPVEVDPTDSSGLKCHQRTEDTAMRSMSLSDTHVDSKY